MAGIYIETFGCQMNQADSEYIAERASAAGYAVVADAGEASVVVLNTCTVREGAERRAYGRMQHLRALKLADPAVRIVVCGCLAEQDRERMQTIAPHVDAVFGTSELVRLGDALAAWRPGYGDDTDYADDRALTAHLGGAADCVQDAFSHLRAFVTVQRGCSYYCTFCIVPHVRGRFDHRPFDKIVADAAAAVRRGAREVMLVGQTVNAYRDATSGADFADLLSAVAGIDGLERLTFVTSHPKDVSDRLLDALDRLPQLNPRFHLPVQSGSDTVLRRMNRKYTVERYLERIDRFRARCPEWLLSTDLIVAFPGETNDDFERTLALCERADFGLAYTFIYSPRRGTPAAHWEQVPEATGSERLRRLVAITDATARAWHDRKVGRTVRALVSGPSRKDPSRLSAKTLDGATVVAPLGREPLESFVEFPWIDVAVERAWVWGASGTLTGRAARFADRGTPVAPADLDLVTLLTR
jgi:tRNA-2-methylthio-N6-dimethylallyladenosine synthase